MRLVTIDVPDLMRSAAAGMAASRRRFEAWAADEQRAIDRLDLGPRCERAERLAKAQADFGAAVGRAVVHYRRWMRHEPGIEPERFAALAAEVVAIETRLTDTRVASAA